MKYEYIPFYMHHDKFFKISSNLLNNQGQVKLL
jgi:hypothetical protein